MEFRIPRRGEFPISIPIFHGVKTTRLPGIPLLFFFDKITLNFRK